MFRRAFTIAVGLLCLVLAVRTFVVLGLVAPVVVRGASMAPAFKDGQSLLVDLHRGQPRRWSPIIIRNPTNAQAYSIKRVLGLPGEKVEFRQGDLWIDGRRSIKTLDQQIQVRQLEHIEGDSQRRWIPWSGDWRCRQGTWIGQPKEETEPATLLYMHQVLDDHPANERVTRRWNRQDDLMIDFDVSASSDAKWELSISGAKFPINLPSPSKVLFSTFDQQALLALNGQLVESIPLAPSTSHSTPTVTVYSGRVSLTNLRLWKDIYYEPQPTAAGSPGDQPWQLGPEEYFVVGDNQAISLDSRTWQAPAGVPQRLIVGRPLLLQGRR